MTVRELLKYGEKRALEYNKEESAIKLLLMHFLGKESYDLIMSMDNDVQEDLSKKFKNGVNIYVEENIPVQHIIGYEYFYGYKFICFININVH
jgi:release factor glutamine methyltransferase